MILLVGGCGFLGRSLADHLYAQGHAIRIFDRHEKIKPRSLEAPGPDYYGGDYLAIENEEAAFKGVSSVVHLVHTTLPATSMNDVWLDANSNILPSIRLIELALRNGVKRFVFISSGGTVYGVPQSLPVGEDQPTNPVCAYGVTKLAIEKYVEFYTRVHGLEGIIVRLANAYGPYQLEGHPIGAAANFLLRTARHEPVEIFGDGTIVRDYVYIDDIVVAIEALLVKQTVRPGIYNLGTGHGYSLRELLNVIEKVCGIAPSVSYRCGRKIDVPEIVLDAARLQQEICWKAQVTLAEGVHRLWESLRGNRDTARGGGPGI